MDWSRFETALTRRLATSSRDHLLILSEQARGIQRRVIEITPPGSQEVKGTSRQARDQGRTAVARDIRKIYGSPGDAFALLQQRNDQVAAAFWEAHTRRDNAEASRLLESVTGKRLYPFDRGRAHAQNRRKTGRVRSRSVLFFVDSEKELADYIKARQKRVQFLQAGWKTAAAKLGLTLPAGISQHQAPGGAIVEVTATRIRIVATNSVGYASNTDLERRIQWAINAQAGAMERQWQQYNERLNRKAGL